MGLNIGFDMVPRLSKGLVDRHNWEAFIEVIKEHYQNDDLVEIKPKYIEFKGIEFEEGEHTLLPLEGHKFLRFSSKTSENHDKGVEDYVDRVSQIAQLSFGSRVRDWNEACDTEGFYNWQDVYESIRSYEQPGEIEFPTPTTQPVLGTDPISELNLPLFAVQSVVGKGRGLVARFNIAKGKRIICEKPLFKTENISPRIFMEAKVVTKLKALSKSEQRQFLSLHNNFPGKNPFSGIVRTNALPCGPESMTGGVYSTISFINHSCLPNAHTCWNSDLDSETIHAIRHIPPGEEITISYKADDSHETRRVHLKDAFGFDCTCSLCSLPPPELQLSDSRRLQIKLLDGAIGNPSRVMSKPDEALADCFCLLQTLHEEYEDITTVLDARLYYDAFQISITHSDQARARIFAERGYETRVICEGENNPETQKMKRLMNTPAGHVAFGLSRRWRTAKEAVPKGLDTGAFEKWLWRQSA